MRKGHLSNKTASYYPPKLKARFHMFPRQPDSTGGHFEQTHIHMEFNLKLACSTSTSGKIIEPTVIGNNAGCS